MAAFVDLWLLFPHKTIIPQSASIRSDDRRVPIGWVLGVIRGLVSWLAGYVTALQLAASGSVGVARARGRAERRSAFTEGPCLV